MIKDLVNMTSIQGCMAPGIIWTIMTAYPYMDMTIYPQR